MPSKSQSWVPFAVVFHPIWLVIFQTILALVFVWDSRNFTWAYAMIVLVPAVLYLLYAFVTYKIKRLTPVKIEEVWEKFGKAEVRLSVLVIFIISLGNILLIYELIDIYGGLSESINGFGSASKLSAVQFNTPRLISYLITLNYLLPVFIVPILMKRGLLPKLLLLIIILPLSFIGSGLFGARILFLDVATSTLLIISLTKKFRTRALMVMLIAVSILLCGLATLQANRSNLDLKGGFEQLGKYYSISLNHGATVVKHNNTQQPLYWTTRSLFGIPIISDVVGFQTVYEGVFGEIPIKDRRDDFNYAAKLGVDPTYNTFSIYGYSFIDAGMFSIVIIFISYIIMHQLYAYYISGKLFGLLLYPGFYCLLLDQLRTNSVFSSRAPFFVLAALAVIVCRLIAREGRRERVLADNLPERRSL